MIFNTFLFNGSLYNDLSGVVPVTADLSDISFSTFPLNSGNCMVTQVQHEAMPERDWDTFALPKRDGGGSLGDYWRGRRIRISGYLQAETRDALDTAIDTMKQYLATENGSLRIVAAGVVREYAGTLVNGASAFARDGFHQTFIPFELQFDCRVPDGYGRAVNYTSLEFLDQTSLAYTEEIPHAGTAKASAIIRVNFAAAVNVSAISFRNNTRDEMLSVTQSFAAGDLFEIDTVNMTVKKNSTEIDYSGQFIHLNPGVNNFTLTLTGVSATYDLTVSHRATYL